MKQGFPNTCDCEHGAGVGEICEQCAGPQNLPLKMALEASMVVKEMRGGIDPRELAEAVRIRDTLLGWATNRELCFASIGPCACWRCAAASMISELEQVEARLNKKGWSMG